MTHPPAGPSTPPPPPGPKMRGPIDNPLPRPTPPPKPKLSYPPGHPQPPEPGPGQPPQPPPRGYVSRPFGQTGGRYGYAMLAVGCTLLAAPVGWVLGWALAVTR